MIASERNNYKRGWYWRRVRHLDHRRFKFIDESGVNLALTRMYGRAGRGERISEKVPRNYGQQTSILSVLGVGGPSARMTIEGAVDTAVFNVYVKEVLWPTLEDGDVVVCAHRASIIEEAAQQRGAQVIWLSPYSPDFSPIEMMWSKIKAYMRTAKARSQQELEKALLAALELVTVDDCLGWFRHCGYQVALNCN